MTIICCRVCKAPTNTHEGIDETEPLILHSTNQCDTLSTIYEDDYQHVHSSSSNTDNETETDVVHSTKKTLLGMSVVALGTALFCSVGAIVQHHGGSVLQLMLGRYITQNIISWFVWFMNPCKTKNNSCTNWFGDKPHRINIWTRGFLLFCTIFFWWRGLELVPLGDGEAILFLSPITTVIAARILLGEPLPSTFFITLIITVCGLIFICQPIFIFGGTDSIALSWKGILFLIGTVFCWTAACVLVRTAKKAHWLQLEIVATTQSIAVWCPLIIIINRFWIHSDGLSGGDWDFSVNTLIVMIVIGILGFLALMLNVIGYQIGDATKVAWMEYLDLVFAFLYQWLVFKEKSSIWEIIGCCCLLSTCLIHLGEEYYHYVKAKKNKRMEYEFIAKAKEGKYNEMEPLLLPSAMKTDDTTGYRLLGFMNKINVFKNSEDVSDQLK